MFTNIKNDGNSVIYLPKLKPGSLVSVGEGEMQGRQNEWHSWVDTVPFIENACKDTKRVVCILVVLGKLSVIIKQYLNILFYEKQIMSSRNLWTVVVLFF